MVKRPNYLSAPFLKYTWQVIKKTDTVSIIHHIYEVVETVELFLSNKTKNEKSELKEMETNGMIGITLNTY